MACSPDLSEDEEMKECLYLLSETDDCENYLPQYDNTEWHLSLMEVFSVRINNIDKENPGDLYGKVMVSDGGGFQSIYNQIIKPGDDNLLLTGPDEYISASQSFTIKVLITDKDNEEVVDGEIYWHAFWGTSVYDRPLNVNIVGRHGSVSVNFVPYSYAAVANVEVALVGEDPANVYGELTATSSEFGDCKSVLFQKAADESKNVSPGQVIPLSRSLVAVPYDSSLVVVANLYDHNTVSSNGEIANGTAEFSIQSFGTLEEQIISGNTILSGITAAVKPSTEVVYSENPDINFVKNTNFSYAIVVVGELPYAETFGDSLNLTITEPGPTTISNVCGGVKCVVVVVSGRPVVIQPYLPQMDALVATWLPGSEGQGVADLLFGDYGFTGKLPRTWFKTVDQLPMNVGDAHYDPLFPLVLDLQQSR